MGLVSDAGKAKPEESCIFGVPLEVAVERSKCHDGIKFSISKNHSDIKINIIFKIFATIFLFVTPMNTCKKENWKLKNINILFYICTVYIFILGIKLPVVVRECIHFIEENGLNVEGIYR